MKSPRDAHEMVRRSAAPRRWGIRANYLDRCRQCHDQLHRDNMPLVVQLAHKLIEDPDNFDLDAINEISGQAPIAMSNVMKYVRILLGA